MKSIRRTTQERNSSETVDDRYAIYVRCAKDLGWTVKSYEDWSRS